MTSGYLHLPTGLLIDELSKENTAFILVGQKGLQSYSIGPWFNSRQGYHLLNIFYTLPPSHGLPIRSNLTRAHFLLVATSDFPLQSNLPNRYIHPANHVTDILHPLAYEDGTDKDLRNVSYY
jgi:hypothetical protein